MTAMNAAPPAVAGAPPPQSDGGPSDATHSGPGGKNKHPDSCAASLAGASVTDWPASAEAGQARVSDVDARIQGLQARFSALGWLSHVTGLESLLAGRWGRWNELSLDEAEQLLARLENGR